MSALFFSFFASKNICCENMLYKIYIKKSMETCKGMSDKLNEKQMTQMWQSEEEFC